MRSSATTTDTDVTASLALDRESFNYLVSDATLCDPAPIRAAVARADYHDAAIRALAACKLGVALAAELVADILVGVDRIEVHVDAIDKGERVLLVDDLIATGGTAEAAVKLIESLGGVVVGCCFVIDLPDLGGRKRLERHGQEVFALCEFEGD